MERTQKKTFEDRLQAFVIFASTLDERGRFCTYENAYLTLHPAASKATARRNYQRYLKLDGIADKIKQRRASVLLQLEESTNCLPIANRFWRVEELQRTYDKLALLVEERGVDTRTSPTGLEVADYKGKDADRLVTAFDKAVLDAMANLRKEAAEELGQALKRIDVTSNGKDLSLLGFSDQELDERIAEAEGRKAQTDLQD